MPTIGIGIIGCGKASQALHLHALMQIPGQARVVALCDPSATVASAVAARHGIPRWTTDQAALLADPRIDAVLVCNPNQFHIASATQALAAGKHVLVEKPAAMSLPDLDMLAAAGRSANRIVQVGYMRRFAPGYHAAQKRLSDIGLIRLARVHDLIDAGMGLLADTIDLVRDLAADPASLNLNQDETVMIHRAIGDTSSEIANAYQLLLRLGCHDLSTMRGLIGWPHRVLHAVTKCAGTYLGATFDFGDFICGFDVGLNIVRGTHAGIEIVGAEGTLSLDYDLPYVRHLPARLTKTLTHDDGDETREIEESHGKDRFVLEWLDFVGNITGGRAPVNSLEDAREDLEIAAAIIDALKPTPTEH